MTEQAQPGGLVQRAGGNADCLPLRSVPEEARAALAAEPAPRSALALGARDPAQGSVFRQHELVAPRRRRGEDVPAPPSALDAVAQQHVAERPADLVPHRAAKTAPGAHGLTLAC